MKKTHFEEPRELLDILQSAESKLVICIRQGTNGNPLRTIESAWVEICQAIKKTKQERLKWNHAQNANTE